MPLNPITVSRVSGKEPLFSIVTVVLVAGICYAISNTGPDYIKQIQRKINTANAEIKQNSRSDAINAYKDTFNETYAPLESAMKEEKFDSSAKLIDIIKETAKKFDLEILNTSRTQEASSNPTANFIDKSTVQINVLFEGELEDALKFIREVGEKEPFHRLARFNATSAASGRDTKYNVTFILPTSDILQ